MGDFSGSIPSQAAFEQPEELVTRLRQGDETAFAEAFELYRNLVYTLSRKLLDNKAEAMDVTQEVFLTLYQKIHRFRGECALKTWLYRITLNQAANRNRWWRRRFRNRTRPLGLTVDDPRQKGFEAVCSQPRPDRCFLSKEVGRAIREGLSRLPFQQRVAVVLRDVEGLDYREIARVTGVRLGTVKSRIARGREQLRKMLEGYRLEKTG